MSTHTKTALHSYVAGDPGFQRTYESYQADETVTAAIAAARPAAHLVVVSEYWCGDSRRLVPRMARLLEHLPGWSVTVMPWNGETRRAPFSVKAIPTFIVYDHAGEGRAEIGRIVESIDRDTLEADLLHIVS